MLGDDGRYMPFNDSCATFITLNPLPDDKQVPDTLKNQFRPIQMILPDSQIIAESLLFVNGFKNSRPLSAKLVKVFKFAETQLGSSAHYDFGLRTLKGVLDQAGQLKQLVLGVVDPLKVERE